MPKAKPKPKLNAKQARFVKEYLIDLNATQAAIRTGYSAKTAYSIGGRLLKHVEVSKAIIAELEKFDEKIGLSSGRILEELSRLAYSNIGDFVTFTDNGDPVVDLSKATREQLAAVSEIQVETYMDGRGDDAREVKRVRFKLHDKKGSAELLGRYRRLFVERVEHDVSQSLAERLAAARARVAARTR